MDQVTSVTTRRARGLNAPKYKHNHGNLLPSTCMTSLYPYARDAALPNRKRCNHPRGTQSVLERSIPTSTTSIIPISNLPSIAEDVMTSTHKSASKSTVMAEG